MQRASISGCGIQQAGITCSAQDGGVTPSCGWHGQKAFVILSTLNTQTGWKVLLQSGHRSHLRIKIAFAQTNQKEGWQVQVLMCEKRLDDAAAASRMVGGRSRGRQPLTLDLASLALRDCIWRTRDAHGDIIRLPYALAKYVQDALHETVDGMPTPSADPLDLATLHGFNRHVRPYLHSPTATQN